jgi:hypothetical protein
MMPLIEISKILYIIGIIVWLIPPIRQYRGKFFDYFLVLAVIDPISIIYGKFTNSSIPLWIFVLFGYLLIISVITEEILKKFKYIFILIPFIFILFTPIMNNNLYFLFLTVENTFLLLVFLRLLILEFVSTKKVHFFYLVLVFYVLTIIFKFFNFLIGFADATAFFIITSIAQIFFGLFFSIVREDKAGITT